MRPPSVVTLAGLALAPAYSWLLIFRRDLRLDGAALAVVAIQARMQLCSAAGRAVRLQHGAMAASGAAGHERGRRVLNVPAAGNLPASH